jgi:small subunit ribosomal protein S13
MKKTKFVKFFLKIYGVGTSELFKRYLKLGINNRVPVNFKHQRFRSLINKIDESLEDSDKYGKKLQAEIQNGILLLQIIQNFKGTRSKFFRPCRGQRTRTNAKTNRKKTQKKAKLQIKKEISSKKKTPFKNIKKKVKSTKIKKRPYKTN